MTVLNMVEAIRETLGAEMARDERILLLGQDIGVNGGVFRATDGLQARFGEEREVVVRRVFEDPIPRDHREVRRDDDGVDQADDLAAAHAVQHRLEVFVGAGDHAAVQVAGAGRGVGFDHLGHLGQVVHQQTSNELTFQVDMRSQAAGMYFMELNADHNGTIVTYTLKYPLIVSR